METGTMFEHEGAWKCITEAEYAYGGLCVRVDTLSSYGDHKCWEPDAVISVNLTAWGYRFPDGHFAVTSHKLDAEYLEAVRVAGGYEDTGETVSYGNFGPIVNPVWRKAAPKEA